MGDHHLPGDRAFGGAAFRMRCGSLDGGQRQWLGRRCKAKGVDAFKGYWSVCSECYVVVGTYCLVVVAMRAFLYLSCPGHVVPFSNGFPALLISFAAIPLVSLFVPSFAKIYLYDRPSSCEFGKRSILVPFMVLLPCRPCRFACLCLHCHFLHIDPILNPTCSNENTLYLPDSMIISQRAITHILKVETCWR
jgi:hypothetical protein